MALVPSATMLGQAAELTERRSEPLAIEYVLTAGIEETGATVGIADSSLWALSKPDGTMDKAAMDEHLDAMQALGVNTVRVVLPWRGNEPTGPGGTQSSWARSDYIINGAAERGMNVLAVLAHPPTWGDTSNVPVPLPGFEFAPDPEAFAGYAARVVERYGDMIGAYEIWNEPNAVTGWAPAIDPAAYTEVLKAAWAAIKGPDGPDEDDPLVVAGVLGAVINFGPATMDPRTFVETMYESGAKGFFDALSFHPYNYKLKFSEGRVSIFEPWKVNSPLEQVIKIRQLMLDNGDEALKIWATEYGLPTFGENALTEALHAEFISDFLNTWKNLKDSQGHFYGGPQFLYSLYDSFLDGTPTDATAMGLFRFDALTGEYVAKLAAQVVKDFIEKWGDPADPPDPSDPPNIAEQIAQALQAVFQSVRAAFAGFSNAVNAFVSSFARAIGAIFGRTPAAAAVQQEVVEGITMAAARSWDPGVHETPSEATESDDAGGPDPAPEVAPVDVSTPEEVTTPGEEVVAEPETVPVEVSVPAEETTAVEGSAEETSVDEVDAETTEEAEDPEESTETAETDTESREPVRTGIVARPGEVGGDDATDDADTTGGDAADASADTDTDTDSGAGSDSEAA